MARIQKKERFIRTPPNCYGPSPSLSNFGPGIYKGRPKHDHDRFRVHFTEAHFSILELPWMSHQMPLLHNGTQRRGKYFSSDVPSSAVSDVAPDANFSGKITGTRPPYPQSRPLRSRFISSSYGGETGSKNTTSNFQTGGGGGEP